MKRELHKALDAAKANLRIEQDDHLATARSLMAEQEKVKKLTADLDQAQRTCEFARTNFEAEKLRQDFRTPMINYSTS